MLTPCGAMVVLVWDWQPCSHKLAASSRRIMATVACKVQCVQSWFHPGTNSNHLSCEEYLVRWSEKVLLTAGRWVRVVYG